MCEATVRPARVRPGGLFGKRLQPRADQRADRFLENHLDQIVRGVITARTLAGEHIGPHVDSAVVADDLVFEQAFINRAELLHAQVTIIDIASALVGRLKRQGVNHVGHDRIAQPHSGQQRRALSVEQATVIGRQADTGIALVNSPAQIIDHRPIAAGVCGKGVVAVLAPSHVTPHLVAQAVIIITIVPHRQ